MTPAWIPEIFGAVMLLVAEVSAGQLVIARAWTRHGRAGAGILVSRLLMGIAMVGILVPSLSFLPNAAWAVIFAIMTAWFAWCLRRESRGHGAVALARGHSAPHLVQSAAMLYAFAALIGPSADNSGASSSGTGGMSGMAWSSSGGPALNAPTLAMLFALLLVACVVRDLDRRARPFAPTVSASAATTPASGAGSAALAVGKACQVTTSVTMAFMLIIMI